jgi:hypothetical protein
MNSKKIMRFLISILYVSFISIANAQEVRVIDNKGTINTIRELIVGTDGLLYAYDGTRDKWLSVDRNLIGWGRNKINAGSDDPLGTQYLRQYNGAPSDLNGWRMIRKGTITAITIQTNGTSDVPNYKVEIEKNNIKTAILTLLVANTELGKHDTTINIDFDEGDFLQCYLDASAVEYPQVLIEIAWRQE